MTVTTSDCRLCGSAAHTVVATETQDTLVYTVATCKQCSLTYTRETYDAVSPFYVTLRTEDLNSEHIWLQGKHKEPAFQQCLLTVRSIRSRNGQNPMPATLLDVGCGTGQWLKAVGTGVDLYGFDASATQVEYARQIAPKVRCAISLQQYREELGSVLPDPDLITLWDVLEHIREPLPFVKELAGALTHGGLLYASVPAALPMKMKQRPLKIGWPASRFSWAPQRHVAHYTPRTLLRICAAAGLQVVRIGAVKVYRRPVSAFELLRRAFFGMTHYVPQLAPQLYVVATKATDATATTDATT
ncbi:MAG: class I SAM-dependent methyltransferase [Herpetosiphon sp.]